MGLSWFPQAFPGHEGPQERTGSRPSGSRWSSCTPVRAGGVRFGPVGHRRGRRNQASAVRVGEPGRTAAGQVRSASHRGVSFVAYRQSTVWVLHPGRDSRPERRRQQFTGDGGGRSRPKFCPQPPAVLLRESYREGGKVKKRTLANLSQWPDDLVRGFRILLKGGVAVKSVDDIFEILRSRPHGHVAAVLGTARRLGLERLLDRRPSRMRSLALAMIAGRVLDPRASRRVGPHPRRPRSWPPRSSIGCSNAAIS